MAAPSLAAVTCDAISPSGGDAAADAAMSSAKETTFLIFSLGAFCPFSSSVGLPISAPAPDSVFSIVEVEGFFRIERSEKDELDGLDGVAYDE